MSSVSTVAVIDYGMGNLHSVASALAHVTPTANIVVTADRDTILAADRCILPGVGAMRDCMAEIRRLGLNEVVQTFANSGKPLLGICVGLQAMMESSEENDGVNCLAMFHGTVNFFGDYHSDVDGTRLKVPHMGWNEVFQNEDHPLWANIADGERFYFVHSYYVEADNLREVAGACTYGIPFAAALTRKNIFAVQFHPEKSGDAGLCLLKNFMEWDSSSDA